MEMRISGARAFNGELRVPGDKSISHRALLIAALSSGYSTITGISSGKDVQATKAMIAKLGAEVTQLGKQIRVLGGRGRLSPPKSTIDVGNSGTLIRLGAGVVAGLGGRYRFAGDDSVNRRPMERIFIPLSRMGATIEASNDGKTAPFVIDSDRLHGIAYEMPVASAQVKSAILFAGLGAEGVTTVIETKPTRRHSEEMLLEAGARIAVKTVLGRTEIEIRNSMLHPVDHDIPGDPSQAAFWIVAALITSGSQVTVRNIYLGELRSDFLEILKRMGADIQISLRSEHAGDVTARSSALRATDILPSEVPGIIDEIPILAVAAAFAEGTTVISGAAELRVKESDRISTMVQALRSFGVVVEEAPDGMSIQGGSELHGAQVSADLDHRVAMSCAILGASVSGETRISGFDSVESSYVDFHRDFTGLTEN